MKNFRLIEPQKNGGRFIDHHKKIKKFTQRKDKAKSQRTLRYKRYEESISGCDFKLGKLSCIC